MNQIPKDEHIYPAKHRFYGDIRVFWDKFLEGYYMEHDGRWTRINAEDIEREAEQPPL